MWFLRRSKLALLFAINFLRLMVIPAPWQCYLSAVLPDFASIPELSFKHFLFVELIFIFFYLFVGNILFLFNKLKLSKLQHEGEC